MSPQVPVDPATLSAEQRDEIMYAFWLDYARKLEREHPEHLAALGMTPEEYARSEMEPALSIDESVAAGWISAAEGRSIQGRATLEDLLELRYTPEEAQRILLKQQERACASST